MSFQTVLNLSNFDRIHGIQKLGNRLRQKSEGIFGPWISGRDDKIYSERDIKSQENGGTFVLSISKSVSCRRVF